MNQADIESKITEIIKEMVGVEDVDLDEDLQDKYDLDSIDLFDFILTVEDEYGIEFSDEDFDKLETPQDVADRVYELVNSK